MEHWPAPLEFVGLSDTEEPTRHFPAGQFSPPDTFPRSIVLSPGYEPLVLDLETFLNDTPYQKRFEIGEYARSTIDYVEQDAVKNCKSEREGDLRELEVALPHVRKFTGLESFRVIPHRVDRALDHGRDSRAHPRAYATCPSHVLKVARALARQLLEDDPTVRSRLNHATRL